MLLLGVDTETTGLDITTCRVIEIGMVLWCTDTQTPISIIGTLLMDEGILPLSEEVKRVTGLDDSMFRKETTFPSDRAFKTLSEYMNKAEYIVAHNGTSFDKPLLENEFKRKGMVLPEKPWIDTRLDIEYPEHVQSKKLNHIAADYGFVNPFSHRAAFDVCTMMKVLSNHDITEIIKNSKEKNIKIKADVGFKDKELPKSRKYMWDPDKKIWWKMVKESKLDIEIKEPLFKVVVLDDKV